MRLTFIFFLLIVSGCKFTSNDSETIRIGGLLPLTGNDSIYGISANNGIQLAIEENNHGSQLLGKTIQFISYDTKSTKLNAEHGMRELYDKENVVAIIGEIASERTLIAAPIAQELKIPLISPTATNPTITDIGDYIFRTCFIDPFQGLAMAKFAFNNLKIKKVAIFSDGRSNYSSGLAEFFIDEFTKLGGVIVFEEDYSHTDNDFTLAIKRIQKSKPQAVFLPGYYNQVSDIVNQAKALKFKPQWLGGDGWDTPEIYSQKNVNLRGGYFTSHFSSEPKDPLALEFIKKYTEKYKQKPDGVAALSYDAARVLFNAIRRANSTENNKIRLALTKTEQFPSVTGKITINKNRDAQKTAFILRVDELKATFVTRVEP